MADTGDRCRADVLASGQIRGLGQSGDGAPRNATEAGEVEVEGGVEGGEEEEEEEEEDYDDTYG